MASVRSNRLPVVSPSRSARRSTAASGGTQARCGWWAAARRRASASRRCPSVGAACWSSLILVRPSVPSWVPRRLAVAELRGHLIHPAPALGMVETHHLVEGPVDMASQVGHLVVNPFHGVAGYPPSGGTSTVCSAPHCGQVTASSDGARPLIRL